MKKIKVTEVGNVFQLIGKEWTLITSGYGKEVNTMTANWGMMGVMWNKNIVLIAVRPERYTYEFMENYDNFSLTFFNKEYKKDLVLLGTKSGRGCDKIKETNLTLKFDNDKIPYFKEANLVIKCKKIFKRSIQEEDFLLEDIKNWYDGPNDIGGKHVFYIGQIQEVLSNKK